jgi:hypothetical protein
MVETKTQRIREKTLPQPLPIREGRRYFCRLLLVVFLP